MYDIMDKRNLRRVKMRTIEIKQNDANQRLDKFLTKHFKTMPKSLMYKYLRKKCIKINGKKASPDVMLQNGDVLTLFIKDEFFEAAEKKSCDFEKAPADIDIIYEDENIILINKKVGVIVHQDKSYHFDCLVSRVQNYLYKKGEYDPESENSFSPALVNRIDRNTGGIVICAKNADSLRILNAKMKSRELKKYYLCVVLGTPKNKSDLLSGYLLKNENQNRVKIYKNAVEGAKEIKTKYTVLSSQNGLSLVMVELLTGRTHQIRAHMASIGHPLVGDEKYGDKKKNNALGVKRQALYSYKLKFDFAESAGILDYLNTKEFEVKNIWFLKDGKINFNTIF